MMTLDRFRALCDAYGGEVRRWPAEEREAAQAFVETSEVAREALAEARRLDDALDQARLTPSPELVRRIAACAPASDRAPSWAAMAAALALAAGLGAGWLGAGPVETRDEALFAEAFGALDAADPLDFLEDA